MGPFIALKYFKIPLSIKLVFGRLQRPVHTKCPATLSCFRLNFRDPADESCGHEVRTTKPVASVFLEPGKKYSKVSTSCMVQVEGVERYARRGPSSEGPP